MLYKNILSVLSPFFGIIPVIFILVTMIGCNEEERVVETLEIINLNPVVSAKGGAVSLDIVSNATWKVGKIDVDWLEVETETGVGDGQLRLSCDENTSVESRTVEFFIVTTKDGKYHKIELTQLSSEPVIELDQHEIEVGSRPRSHEIALHTNVPPGGISVEIQYEQEEGDNWVVGLIIEPDVLKFQTILNSLPEQRIATIILSYIDISGEEIEVWDRVTVTQMASGNEPPAEYVDFSYVKELPLGEIVENIYIEGNIVSTGVSDNFRQGTYIIQDANSSAIAFEAVENLLLNKYDKIHLLLDGTQVETFEDCGVQYRVIRGMNASNILMSASDADFSPEVINISDLRDEHLLAVVTLQGVEFAMPHGAYANFHEYYLDPTRLAQYADYPARHYPAPIRDIRGDNINVITNREVTYRRKSVPKGSGTITGLVVKITDSAYGNLGAYSIRHLEESDIAVDSDQANGFSEVLVEWELGPTTGFANGTSNFPPTTGPSGATLQKDGSPGFFTASGTANGVYFIAKYRGDRSGSSSEIANACYNVNNWGTGRYWIMDNVSTLGITTSLSLQVESNSSNGGTGTGGGPRDFVVEYSLDGDNWHNVGAYQVTGQIGANLSEDVIPSHQVFTFSLPDELLDKPNIKIRLLNVTNTTVRGGSITTGTNRLSYFSIKYHK